MPGCEYQRRPDLELDPAAPPEADGDVISDIYRERVVARGLGSGAWGWSWGTAYQLKGGA